MLQTLKNAWKTKEIRSKILFTVFILLLYRIGTVIPVPFVDSNKISGTFSGTIFDYLNTLSGGSLGTATLFALGVQPYINASIIIQLLGVVFPNSIGTWAKEDKQKFNFLTRIVTVALALVTAIAYYFYLKNNNALTKAAAAGENSTFWLYGIAIVLCYCAGASIIMWLGERINESGIGNGISLILFANIVASVPSFAINLTELVIGTYGYKNNSPVLYGILSTLFAIVLVVAVVALLVLIIWVTGSERRIPIQYAKKVVGRKMYGGQSTNLPIKLNMTGVMPIIFASSIVSLVPTILQFAGVTESTKGGWGVVAKIFSTSGVLYPIVLFALIIAFAYFYTQITFDPNEVANNLKRQGGAIPGIRQGKPTADYIKKILGKVTLVGALFLGFIALLPSLAGPHLIKPILEWFIKGAYTPELAAQYATSISNSASQLSSVFTFGGTTLLIVVGVAIETFRELEAQLTMRNYKGFLN